jgi:ABC-type transport system substrate-binding protein
MTKACTPLFYLLLNILIVIYSCQPVDKSKSVGYFRYNEDAGISTIDPIYVRSQAEIWVCSNLFEGLIEIDENLNFIPCLADSWTLDNTSKIWTFYLKKGVHFVLSDGSKGHEMTAEDVVYSFERLMNPKNASPGAWILNDKIDLEVLRSKEYKHPKYPFYAPAPHVFQLRLQAPFAALLSLLAMPYCAVVNPKILEHDASEFRKAPSGTGPFRMVAWEEEVQILLHKNNHYHVQSPTPLPLLDGVSIDLNKNKQAAFMGFLSGKYDFFNGIHALFKDELFTQEGKLKTSYAQRFELQTAPFLNTEYIGFNLRDKPQGMDAASFQKLRYFLNHCTDKQEMIRYLKNGLGYPSNGGFVPKGIEGFGALQTETNPDLQDSFRLFMRSLGFSKQKGLKLPLHTTSDYVDIALFLKNQWKNYYIDLSIEVHPGNFLRQLRNDGKALLFRGSWIADYPDAENFLACFYGPYKSPMGPNYTHFKNTTYDSLYNACLTTTDPLRRKQQMQKMDAILSDQAPVLPLFFDQSVRLHAHNIKGLKAHPMNYLKLKNVSKQ